MGKRKRPETVVDAINHIADEVNRILDEREGMNYFYGVVLIYSFLENVLKWLVFAKKAWNMADAHVTIARVEALRTSCRRLTFNDALTEARSLKLVDAALLRRIDLIRKERNDIIHQCWLYLNRGDKAVLRKKLEKLARASNALVGVFNRVTKKIPVDELYDVWL